MRRFPVFLTLLVFAGCGEPLKAPPPPPPSPPPSAPRFEEIGSATVWFKPYALNDSGVAIGTVKPSTYMPLTAYSPAVAYRGVIRTLSSVEGRPGALTERGAVASAMHLPHGRDLRIYDEQGEHVIPISAEMLSLQVIAMNEAGDVLATDFTYGDLENRQYGIGLFVRGGVIQDIGYLHPEHHWITVAAMNESSQIVGGSVAGRNYESSDETPGIDEFYHPFLWQNGVMRDLGVFGKSDACVSRPAERCATGFALGINNRGDVVGYSEDSNYVRRPFLWHDEVMIDLGVFREGAATARFINDRGQIAGDNDTLAFLWESARVVLIGSLGGQALEVTAMNERGDVAGTGFAPDGKQHAWVWRDGQLIDLGIPLTAGCAARPVDINERGAVLIAILMRCWPRHDSPLNNFSFELEQRAVVWHPVGQ